MNPTTEATMAALKAHHAERAPKTKARIKQFLNKRHFQFRLRWNWQLALGVALRNETCLGTNYIIVAIWILPASMTFTWTKAVPYKASELQNA